MAAGEGQSMSFLETLKNSAVSGVPDLSAFVAPTDLYLWQTYVR